MVDCLAPIVPCVYDDTEAFLQIFFFGNARGRVKKRSHQSHVIDLTYIVEVLSWNNENMCGRLWIYVPNGEGIFILINKGCIDLFMMNGTKKTICLFGMVFF